MRITACAIAGVVQIDFPQHQDARGGFQRIWCADDFKAAGLDFAPVQSSLSTNLAAQTLRGLHWQAGEAAEQKLVRAVAGRIWDVAVDLRPDSASYRRWHGVVLDAMGGAALLLPRGVAHGFVTLTPEAAVAYLIDRPHDAKAARGARWDDPAFGISWPVPPVVIADKDRTWPDFRDG